MPAKVIFIGLDAAEPALLRKWAAEGLLPNIRRLEEQGVAGAVRVPAGMGNGATWPTFFTGVNPGRHGRYFYRQFERSSYQFVQFNDDTDLRHEPFWLQLSAAGRKCAVVDVTHAPLRAFNGVQIADWITHDRGLPARSHPPQLIDEITERYGADPSNGNTDVYGIRPSDDCARLRDQIVERARMKTALGCDLLQREAWDAFLIVYHDAHDLCHQCWHLHDPTHPAHDAAWVRRHGDPFKQLFMELDRGVGELMKHAGADAVTMVFTGPGMEPNYNGNDLLDKVLEKLENAYTGKQPTLSDRMRAAYHRLIPEDIRAQLHLRKRVGVAAATDESARPALSYRKFFAVPHNQNAGAVRFNLVGRDPFGVVRPGTEYETLRQRLIADLRQIVNVNGGAPVIKDIIDVAQNCDGEQRDDMPDLLLLWSRAAPIGTVRSELIGRVSEKDISSRSGDHTQNSVLWVAGSGIQGHIPTHARTEDLAPSIAQLLGVELIDVDGTSLVPHWRGPSSPRPTN